MTSNGQGPSPRAPRGGGDRHARGADRRRRDVGARWSVVAAASARPAAGARPDAAVRDDSAVDFVRAAIQGTFQ